MATADRCLRQRPRRPPVSVDFIPACRVSDADWDRVVRHARLGQWWHFSDWRRYSLAFAGPNAEDDSFAVRIGDRLEAVCPLIWEGRAYTMGGEPGPMPAAWSEAALVLCLDEAYRRAKERGAPLSFRMPPGKSMLPSTATPGWEKGGWQTRVVALTYAGSVLWRNVRKSYHSLIHRAHKTHRLVVSCGSSLAADYEALHKATVGTHMPRPDLTYELQAAWLTDGRAMLLGAQSKAHGQWDAFVYLFVHQGHVYYGSGPARPNVTVMHGLQWEALMECQARGHQQYEMGWQGHAADTKGQNIELFKRGFGGQDVPLEVWTHA